MRVQRLPEAGGRGLVSKRVTGRHRWFPVVAVGSLLVGSLVAAGAGFAATADQPSAAPAGKPDPNPNCTLVVPAHPLSAQGLATPYQLTATDPAQGPCHEANADQSAFVEAAVLTPGGKLTLYDPLVVDRGTRPVAPPAAAHVPAGSTVGIWFGYNGADLTLRAARHSDSLRQGKCVNGQQRSVFGQFAYCNGPAFFTAASHRITAGTLKVPALGTAADGLPCPTVRDFSVVDQDQSDNVVTHYLATAQGRTAQNNAAARARLGNHFTDLSNGSDNLLLTQFIDPALDCTPWTVADQSSDGQPQGALPLDELQAAARQKAPVALVPLNDPMTVAGNGRPDTAKTNLYRAGVDQKQIGAGGNSGDGATYCRNMFGPSGVQRVFNDREIFSRAPSVDPGMATNLFTFLAMRANQSFTNLHCGRLTRTANPVTLVTDANGVVVDARLNTGTGPTASASPTATPSAASPSPSPPADPSPSTTPSASPSTSPSAIVSPSAQR